MLTTAVSAISVTEAIDKIDDEFRSEEDLLMIFGQEDNGAYLQIFAQILGDNVQTHEIGPGFIDFDKYATVNNQNLIILGGPCANTFWNDYSKETCENWPYKVGESVIKVVEDEGRTILLIAGTSKEDTLEIAEKVSNYQSYNQLSTSDSIIFYSERVEESNLCEKIKENSCPEGDNSCILYGASFTTDVRYKQKIGNSVFRIKATNFDFSENSITLSVNGEERKIRKGQEEVFDGVTFTVCEFGGVTYSSVQLAYDKASYGLKTPRGMTSNLFDDLPLSHTDSLDQSTSFVFKHQSKYVYLEEIEILNFEEKRIRLLLNDELITLEEGDSKSVLGLTLTFEEIDEGARYFEDEEPQPTLKFVLS